MYYIISQKKTLGPCCDYREGLSLLLFVNVTKVLRSSMFTLIKQVILYLNEKTTRGFIVHVSVIDGCSCLEGETGKLVTNCVGVRGGMERVSMPTT